MIGLVENLMIFEKGKNALFLSDGLVLRVPASPNTNCKDKEVKPDFH